MAGLDPATHARRGETFDGSAQRVRRGWPGQPAEAPIDLTIFTLGERSTPAPTARASPGSSLGVSRGAPGRSRSRSPRGAWRVRRQTSVPLVWRARRAPTATGATYCPCIAASKLRPRSISSRSRCSSVRRCDQAHDQKPGVAAIGEEAAARSPRPPPCRRAARVDQRVEARRRRVGDDRLDILDLDARLALRIKHQLGDFAAGRHRGRRRAARRDSRAPPARSSSPAARASASISGPSERLSSG